MRNNNRTSLLSSRHVLIQSMAGTVIASKSVESMSTAAVSDWAASYLDAKSTTTVARRKLQRTSGTRVNEVNLELHLRSESENDGALRASSDVRVVLNHGLQKEHW
jgi:hypothetical protein